MEHTKSTKHALFSGVVTMLLCIAMLVGTTFAWFTDSAGSDGNIIRTGSFDIKMYWSDTLLSSDSGDWKDVEAAENNTLFNYQNWEPGYTDVKYIKIVNNGSLSFQYVLNIIPVNNTDTDTAVSDESGEAETTQETVNLADVIHVYYVESPTEAFTEAAINTAVLSDVIDNKVTAGGVLLADGQTKEGFYSGEIIIAIALKMQDSAGIEYQNQSIGEGFRVQLTATQYAYESDYFGTPYDETIAFPIEETSEPSADADN